MTSSSAIMLGVFDGYLPLSHDLLTSMTKAGGVATFYQPHATASSPPSPPPTTAAAAPSESPPPTPSSSSSSSPISDEQRKCRSCGETMYLLVQAFCPLPSVPVGLPHHRMLYVYCCNSAECAAKPTDSWRAFSYQLDVDDVEAFDANDSEDDEPVPVEATPAQFLREFHSFPPVAIDILPEPSKEVIVPTDVEAEIIRTVEERQRYGEADQEDLQELENHLDLKAKSTDYYFDHFRRRIARCGSQILRYQHGGAPIFMNMEKTLQVTVPPCAHCGGPRAMELQVVPTVLYYLRSKNYVPAGKKSGDDGVDFATATVYVCKKGCLGTRKGMVLQEEFLFVEPAPTMGEETGAEGRPSLRQYFESKLTAAEAQSEAPADDADDA